MVSALEKHQLVCAILVLCVTAAWAQGMCQLVVCIILICACNAIETIYFRVLCVQGGPKKPAFVFYYIVLKILLSLLKLYC